MNIKSTRQFICDKKAKADAVPEELREKINDILAKNYARRGKTYSTTVLGSQGQGQEQLINQQSHVNDKRNHAEVDELYEQEKA